MEILHLIKVRRAEDEASAEFRYLFESVVLEARRAYDDVRVTVGRPGEDLVVPTDPVDVLAVGEANVLLRSPSLVRMREVLREGADLVVPAPVSSVISPEDGPLYTVRDFEVLEDRWLAGNVGQPRSEVPSQLPVALWSVDAFRRVAEKVSAARTLADRELLLHIDTSLTIGQAGLYHAFIDYYGELRTDVMEFVPEGAREVLEIGCGRGHTGRHLRERIGCRVTGVELNPMIAAEAEHNLDRIIVGDVAEIEIEGTYDAVLALELLEHLQEPEFFLAKIRSLVRPNGRIVLSVPNVGHYSVVEDLLAGRWDYVPIGLLCYTHLRFFTRQTLQDWIERCGFERYELVPQRTELPPEFGRLESPFVTDLDSLATKGFYVILHC
jgi:2-polyprenyl-3-methyl-5-hydroxy-6-metoxy-1,4-benzoquinol methylase